MAKFRIAIIWFVLAFLFAPLLERLDFVSGTLVVLALLVAPWVLPRLLNGVGIAAESAEEHKEFMDQIRR